MEIKDYMVFIGPQASGKSTLAKLIYFFSEINKTYRQTTIPTFALNYFLFDGDSNLVDLLKNDIRKLFTSIFPTFRNGKISFMYGVEYRIDINVLNLIEQFQDDITISNGFKEDVEYIEETLNTFYKNKKNSSKDRNLSIEVIAKLIDNLILEQARRNFIKNDLKLVNTFIPAGRSILPLLSNSVSLVESNSLDYFNTEFIKLTNTIRRNFLASPNYSKLFGMTAKINSSTNDSDVFLLSNKVSRQIMRGDFQVGNGGDEIVHYSNGFGYAIPLKYTSSGQQEASWLINTLNYLLTESRSSEGSSYNTIIEEPEAHLFPEAQRDITYLITILANSKHSQTIITTHSPYVLAALNNLLKAHDVGQIYRERVSNIVDSLLWVNSKRLFVGYLDEGKIIEILDQETNLISHDLLDQVSNDIMNSFDDLLEIQYDE